MVGWERDEEGEALGETDGTLAPRRWRGPDESGECRGDDLGETGEPREGVVVLLAVYADSIGEAPPTEAVCLWLPPAAATAAAAVPGLPSKVLKRDEADELEVTVVERDEGNE